MKTNSTLGWACLIISMFLYTESSQKMDIPHLFGLFFNGAALGFFGRNCIIIFKKYFREK